MILGAATTVSLAGTLLTLIGLVLDPYVRTITGTAPVDGVTSVSVVEERIHGIILGLSAFSAVLLAFFFGALLAGRFFPFHAGLNGIVMGTSIVAVPLAFLLGSIVFVLLEPTRNLDDAYIQSENLRMLTVAFIVLSLISPVAVLTGFWGGRVGERFGG